MTNHREKLNPCTGQLPSHCSGFSPWSVRDSNFTQTAASRHLVLLTALVLGAGSGFAQIVNVSLPEPPTASIEGVVTAGGGQGQVDAVPGVLVKLTGTSSAPASLSATTDADGHYRFARLFPGPYTIEARLDGFKPFVESVSLHPGDATIQNVSLELDRVIQKIEVRDKATAFAPEGTNSTARTSAGQFISLPLEEQKFTAALPLIPDVVRTRNGTLNFKGAPEEQGMLLMDSAQNVDPVTGNFSIPIPLDAIQTMDVNETPYGAEYGGFSGGLTAIETKPPSGDWHYAMMDFIPGFRGRSGHIVGLSNLTPRLFFGGPLVKNKLNFSEAFTYDLNRSPVRGLAWPNNETKLQGFDTFTSFQAVLSPHHLLSVNINGFSNRTQFADITALIPQTASSDEGQRGASIGATDSYQFISGALLSTIFRYTRFDSNAHGQGPEDMLITPEGWGGNFFNVWRRTSNQFELLPVYKFPRKTAWGRHELKVGADLTHRSYLGANQSHPIQLLRQDGSLDEQIAFQGGGRLQAQDTEAAEFVQDHWLVTDHLALDLGSRFSSQSISRSAAFAPRAGLVYAPGENGKTIIRAGAGLFYDRFPLLAADFLENPTRVASFYNEAGSLLQPPEIFQNAYVARGPDGVFVPAGRYLNTSPRNITANFEADRALGHGMVVRASYLYSQTQNLDFVTPVNGAPGGNSLLGLANSGGSQYHEFEVTLRYRPRERSEFNVSYVRSAARGDLNTLSDIYVPLEQPVMRPDFSGVLAQSVPNRIIGWGTFALPWKLTVSPVADVHSGSPYSNVDTLQSYVGMPNNQRFPEFFSLDVKVYREFQLHLPFLGNLKNRKFRIGAYALNLTNHPNPLEIYNNVVSPDFGHFAGFQHRVDGLVIDLVN